MTPVADIASRVCDMVSDGVEGQCRVAATDYGLTRFANSFIHQHHGEETATVSLRVAVDGRVATVSTTRTGDDDLRRLVADAEEAARLQPPDPYWPGVASSERSSGHGHTDPSTIEATPADRARRVGEFVEAAGQNLAAGYLDTDHTRMAVATTDGLLREGSSTRSTLDGIHRSPSLAGNGHQTSVRFADIDGGAAGQRAAGLAAGGRSEVEVPPGEYEVVLSPECMATVGIFLGGYGFASRSFLDGQSFVELGAAQFDPAFHLVDDPERSDAIGFGFDADGTLKRRMTLVEGGVTRAVVYDRRTAVEGGAETTGHALAGGWFGPMPSNLVIGGGEQSPEDLVAGVERGLFVSTFNYCRILDPRTQVVTGLTRNGTFLIEDGEITSPVSNLRFTQSFVGALSPGRILGIGNDARYADSEFGPGVVIAPTMRLAGWNFTGGAQG